MRVALFITCFNDLLFPEVGRAVVALLGRLGHEAEFPSGQTCCGQMHFNSGYRDECTPLVRRFADVFAGYDAVVTPSASCAAMVRLLRVGDRPSRLLGAVDGLTLVDLPHADECCGFGGTFAIKNAGTSVAMGIDKVEQIHASGAEVLTAADTSCLMHIGGLLSRRGSSLRVMHLAEILA